MRRSVKVSWGVVLLVGWSEASGMRRGVSRGERREADRPPPSRWTGTGRSSRDAGTPVGGGLVAAEARPVVVQLAAQLADRGPATARSACSGPACARCRPSRATIRRSRASASSARPGSRCGSRPARGPASGCCRAAAPRRRPAGAGRGRRRSAPRATRPSSGAAARRRSRAAAGPARTGRPCPSPGRRGGGRTWTAGRRRSASIIGKASGSLPCSTRRTNQRQERATVSATASSFRLRAPQAPEVDASTLSCRAW